MHPLLAALPIPPIATPVNTTSQALFTFAQIPLVVVALWLTIQQGRRNGTWVPLILVLSGTLTVVIEPVVDILGCCWFYAPHQWTLFTSLGVHEPVWILPAYCWFFGGQAALCWSQLRKAPTARTLTRLYLLVFLADALLEHGGLYLSVFTYYGHQPFTFTRFPLWWAAINSLTPVVTAMIALYVAPLLRGRRSLLLLGVGPFACAFTNGGAGWPVYLTINTNLSKPVVWLAGCVTVALAMGMISILRSILREAPPRSALDQHAALVLPEPDLVGALH